MPTPQIGFLAKISINDGSASAHVDVQDNVTFNFPDLTVDEAEDKRLTAGIFKQYFPKLQEWGVVTIEAYYTKALYARIRALAGKNPTEFKLYPPDEDGAGVLVAEVGTVTGFVKKVGGPKFAKNDETMFTFEFRANGVTFANGANNPAAAPATA